MARRADILVAQTTGTQIYIGAGTDYIVESVAGDLYVIYLGSDSDLYFKKSTDGGLSWNIPVLIFTGTVTACAVWYDRWSNISAGLIHCAYTESDTDDVLYRTINTESSDALSTQTVIFAGASTAAGGNLTIARARGGNVYCKLVIDAGTEGGFYRLPNANVPNGAWDAARTVDEAIATTDQMILVPNLTSADNQDMTAFFWDASADEISRKIYDDSANSWAETSIATSMVDQTAATAYPHMAACVDLANSRFFLVAWSAIDAANADLRCWIITESSITEVTNVVLNSTDDQGLAAISLNTVTSELMVFYGGKSDGSETYGTSIKVYCKGSRDAGTTWGPETLLSTLPAYDISWMFTCPRTVRPPAVMYHIDTTLDTIQMNVDTTPPRAQSMLGV